MTLNQLFPGNTGRLMLIRVMIKLRKPELKEIPGDRPLPADLAALIQKTLKEIGVG